MKSDPQRSLFLAGVLGRDACWYPEGPGVEGFTMEVTELTSVAVIDG